MVYWDGKLMLDLVGMEKVETLPILVSIMRQIKILGILKIPASTISLTNIIKSILYS